LGEEVKIIEIRVKLLHDADQRESLALGEYLKDLIYMEEEPAVMDVTYEVRDDYQE
jgi:hypothetical protein